MWVVGSLWVLLSPLRWSIFAPVSTPGPSSRGRVPRDPLPILCPSRSRLTIHAHLDAANQLLHLYLTTTTSTSASYSFILFNHHPDARSHCRQDAREGHQGLLVTSIRQIARLQHLIPAFRSPIPALPVLLGPNPTAKRPIPSIIPLLYSTQCTSAQLIVPFKISQLSNLRTFVLSACTCVSSCDAAQPQTLVETSP